MLHIKRHTTFGLYGLIFGLTLCLSLVVNPLNAEETAPEPGIEWSPKDVVIIQLEALQKNDTPEPDAGIARAWAFAHPMNKRATGPLAAFTRMLKSTTYRPLLNHRTHEVDILYIERTHQEFAVTVETKDGKILGYRWQVSKVQDGELAGAWMTTGVSSPVNLGNAI